MTFNEWIEEIIIADKRYEHLKDVSFILERKDFLKRYKAGFTPNEALEREYAEYG